MRESRVRHTREEPDTRGRSRTHEGGAGYTREEPDTRGRSRIHERGAGYTREEPQDTEISSTKFKMLQDGNVEKKNYGSIDGNMLNPFTKQVDRVIFHPIRNSPTVVNIMISLVL